MRDLYNGLLLKQVEPSVTQTNDSTALVGAIIDHQGYGSALYLINLGALTDADMTAVVLLEEGDESNLSDNAAVADKDMNGTEAAAGFTFTNDGEIRKLGYKGSKRYTRLTITPSSNNAGDIPIGVMCVLGDPHLGPPTQGTT
jgi:hypothetical protein